MEANLLPYLAARVSDRPVQDGEMATLLSPWIAVTTAHALPKGPLSSEGQHVVWLDFPESRNFHDVRATVAAYDDDVDFAVLKLDGPLELPTAATIFRAEPSQWHPWRPGTHLCVAVIVNLHGTSRGVFDTRSQSHFVSLFHACYSAFCHQPQPRFH